MKKINSLFILLFLGGFFLGCTKNLPRYYEVYRNDFEKGRGDLSVYNFYDLVRYLKKKHKFLSDR